MKKTVGLVLMALLACVLVLGAMAEEAEYTSGDYTYRILTDGTAEIVGYVGRGKHVEIPGEIGGLEVTSIGDEAFGHCQSLETITIPNSIVSINISPFLYCYNLTEINVNSDNIALASIDGVLFSKADKRLICCPRQLSLNDDFIYDYQIPQGIEIIEDYAFNGCERLTSIIIPDSVVTIGIWAFAVCRNLQDISIPNSVTNIGEHAFHLCDSLKSVTIPDNITCISTEMFYCCSSLLNITIPNSVTCINIGAFNGCSSLTSITIPNSVTIVEANPFYNCRKLSNIFVSSDHPAFEMIDGVLFSKADNQLICYPPALSSEEYIIPQGTKSISYGAFGYCSLLKTITIPESINSIDNGAFASCHSLYSITIPDSVTSIGFNAFGGCLNLTSITIPCSVTSIGNFAFWGCSSLTTITIPDSVTCIGDYAFDTCESMTSITIPDSVTSMGESVFYGCKNLKTLTVPRDSYARQYCIDNNLNYTYPDANAWLND